ncbi:ArsR/SmtB family transcription factor [Spirosoma validum]|uniref:Winged helix-turn-helix transcriptional regulator n=1 Tax=Spirosoma validum TaxID=2771355 RepID=A0A927GCM5_9BACT|nr:metalloregulator ArsR/SmtB family transcription factor [Spirosoma validum]MBD2752636.1 winged helix-turn-helix transcriptional regulator [Spirosoma validum]
MKAIATNNQLASELLKTIAHPVRLRILLLLSEQPTLNVSALQAVLNLEQSAISHHLIRMRDRGILKSDKRERDMYYYLADPAFLEVVQLMLDHKSV